MKMSKADHRDWADGILSNSIIDNDVFPVEEYAIAQLVAQLANSDDQWDDDDIAAITKKINLSLNSPDLMAGRE